MFKHHKDVKELKKDIITMINNATDEEIKLTYKVLNSFFN